jgi:O-antigen ligase
LRVLPGLPWICSGFLAASLFSHTVALRLLLLLCGAVLAAAALWQERGALRPLPPVWLAFALWAAWGLASLAWSIEPERTLKEWRNEVVYAGIAFWICFVGAQAANAGRVVPPMAALAVAAAIAAALYTFTRGWEAYLVGPHSGPGDHSSALLTLMPCVAMAAWYGRQVRWPRARLLALGLLAVLFVISAFATRNRTVWLGFAAEFALLGGLLLAHARTGAGRIGGHRITAVAVIVLAIAATSFSVHTRREAEGTKPLEADSRLALWPEVVKRIEARPWTGYGFGRGLLRDPLQDDFGAVDANLWHAHNIVLEALVQTGVPGLALLALLMGALLREGWRYVRSADPRAIACGAALMAIVAGMLVRNMTDTLFVRQNALLFWAVAGFLLGYAINCAGARETTPPSRS